MNALTLRFSGPDAASAAHEAAALLAADWGLPTAPEEEAAPPVTFRSPDALTLATLAVQIPAAALATWELADRMRLVARVRALLDRLKATGAHVTVSLPGAAARPIAAVTPADLLAAAPTARPAWPPVIWDLFLAHASADADAARALHAALAPRARTFLDAVSIPPGAVWPVALQHALEGSRTIAVLVPKDVAPAWYLLDEMVRAIGLVRADPNRWTLIPIWRDGFPRDPLSTPYGLASLQGVDGRGGPKAVADALLAAMGR